MPLFKGMGVSVLRILDIYMYIEFTAFFLLFLGGGEEGSKF